MFYEEVLDVLKKEKKDLAHFKQGRLWTSRPGCHAQVMWLGVGSEMIRVLLAANIVHVHDQDNNDKHDGDVTSAGRTARLRSHGLKPTMAWQIG